MIFAQFSLKGKSGIVTGGGTGLGKAIASALVQAGAKIIISGRRKDVLEETSRELEGFGGPVVPFQADLSKMKHIPKIVEKALKEFGKVDFLFNNAGAIHNAPVEEFSEKDWDLVISTNLKGPFFLSQAVAKTMIAAKRPGVIINISSLMAFVSRSDNPAYVASKGGLSQVTKTMANGLAKYGIRVNAIGPGWFLTDLTKGVRGNSERYEEITRHIPMRRWGKPDELGGVAIFLASDASSYLTGQTIVVDGGILGFAS
jgi:NAD(P)-dependent dehydrogenase (short-subunit alcohol dehydrogenase family)